MVDTTDLVAAILRDYVEPGHYFTMNRSRQVGKTTTLDALRRALAPSSFVVIESFEGRAGLFDSVFACATGLLRTFARANPRVSVPHANQLQPHHYSTR